MYPSYINIPLLFSKMVKVKTVPRRRFMSIRYFINNGQRLPSTSPLYDLQERIATNVTRLGDASEGMANLTEELFGLCKGYMDAVQTLHRQLAVANETIDRLQQLVTDPTPDSPASPDAC